MWTKESEITEIIGSKTAQKNVFRRVYNIEDPRHRFFMNSNSPFQMHTLLDLYEAIKMFGIVEMPGGRFLFQKSIYLKYDGPKTWAKVLAAMDEAGLDWRSLLRGRPPPNLKDLESDVDTKVAELLPLIEKYIKLRQSADSL